MDLDAVAASGPVVGPDGAIYYPVGRTILAVSPQGQLLWSTAVPHAWRSAPPRLSPSGEVLFWEEVVIDARDGSLQSLEVPLDAGRYKYLVGADGRTYLRAGNIVMEWAQVGTAVEIVRSTTWNYKKFVILLSSPNDAGVTRDGVVWLLYSNFSGSKAIWLRADGRVLGTASYPSTRSQVVAVGADNTTYLCGAQVSGLECRAFSPHDAEVVWQLPLPEGDWVTGGALAPGRLYVTSAVIGEGFLVAIGEHEQASAEPEVGADEAALSVESLSECSVWTGCWRDAVCVTTLRAAEAAIAQGAYPCYCPQLAEQW